MLLPRDKNYAELLLNRKSAFIGQGSFGRSTCFFGQTLRDFVELLRSLSEAEAAYEKLRRTKKHSAEAIFSQLDDKKKGTLDKSDFRAYLQR